MAVATKAPKYDVTDLELADAGVRRTEWAAREMPVLGQIRTRVAKERPFAGIRIAACLHVTTETANLALALRDGGAEVALCASNPLSTQDDAAAALVAREGIAVFARKGEDRDTYYRHINAVLETKPHITMDDGADVVTLLHTERRELLAGVRGGTEETTTGVIRLRATAAEAARRGDVFSTATGNLNVIGRAHFGLLKDGAILANVGHFNDEIELGVLAEMAKGRRQIRPFVEEFQLPGKKVFVLAEGRLLNHAAAEANPAAVMDMSFANQALSIEYLLRHAKELEPRVYSVPRELDEEIARRKLEAMGMNIDKMTAAQAEYARSWKAGT